MYIGSAGRGPGGRTGGGRTGGRRVPGHGRADGRADGRAAGTILNDSTTIFIDFHKKQQNTSGFSVVSHPAEAQVPIFTAQMKKASNKCQKSIVFFDFSNNARAQVPFFTPKMKKMELARSAYFARLSTRKWDFRRRSRPRELAQRSQDDVSLNKLPQMICVMQQEMLKETPGLASENSQVSYLREGWCESKLQQSLLRLRHL